MLSPYDWNEAVQHRAEFVEERLRGGSPVVGLRYGNGILLLTLRRTQRKIFEVYDRLMFSAVGNQADIEAVRIGALDFAHQEGFSRSPDDVTINRLVGFAISPALKKAFGDSWSAPLVFSGVFAELGVKRENDRFATLNYDGEFAYSDRYAVVAGNPFAEERMVERLAAFDPEAPLGDAVRAALEAWALGQRAAEHSGQAKDEEEENVGESDETPLDFLKDHLKTLTVEAAVLEHSTRRESKFRVLREDEVGVE
jgi:proteasome alpha subunit